MGSITIIDTSANYEKLAMAIVKRAILDYENGMNMMTKGFSKKSNRHIEGEKQVKDVERFFHTPWASMLLKSDGAKIFNQIKDNYEKYGKCMPFIDEEELESKD